MTENQPDVYFSWKPDEQNESSDTFASEARPGGDAEGLSSVARITKNLDLPCMSKEMPLRSIRERKKPFKAETKALDQSLDSSLNFKKSTVFARPTLFRDARRSLLSNSREFCDCLSNEHILTNAQCPLNIILLSYPHLAFLYEESATPIVKALKEDEDDTDPISLKEELFSASCEKDDCGAEPFQPYTTEEHEAIAKKLYQFAKKLSSAFIADAPCPSPPLKETDSSPPFIGYGDVLDGLLSPQIGAIPVQQVQVCALQVMVSSPENKLHEQSPNQESARPSAEEPRAQQIVCAAVSRDPRISRTSVDSNDPRLTDGNEKYKPKDGNPGELPKAPFGFEKNNTGNALVDVTRLGGNSHPKAKAPPADMSVPRDQGPRKNSSLPTVQGPSKDKCPTKPPTPKVVPPPAALTPHVHKEIGCEVCSKSEDDRRKQTSNVSVPAKVSERRMSSKENILDFNDSGNKHTEKQPLQASHNAPSGSSAKIAVPPLATHRIACSTAVAMTTYRIPKKKPVSKPSQPSKPINMDVSKSHSSIKPKIRPYLPPKDKNESEKNATSVQLAKRTHNFPSKKPESANPSRSESAKESSTDKKSKGKTDTSPHGHSSSLKNKSDKTKHTSKSLASKPEKCKPELKNKKYVDVDIFAPSSSTNATDPELAVAKDSGKKSSSGTTAPSDKSSTSKCSTGKDGKGPVKLAVPPVASSENKNTSKSKTSVTKSDSKKPTSQATGISTKDSHAQATKKKTVLALDSPAAQQVKKPSPQDLPPVPKPLKEPVMPTTSPPNARVASGTDLPASKKSNLLMTLMGDDINQPAAAKVSLCELKVAKDASTPSSKEAEMQDKAVKKKSKLSLPKISPTSESLSKSAAEATETAKDKTIPNSSLLADKAAIDLKIAGKKKQLGTAETSLTASKSTLSQTKSTQLKVKSTSESLSKSTAATSKSDRDKTVPESSVPSDKGAIDLKIAGEKKRKETSENRVPSTASKSKLSRTKSTEQKISPTNGSLSKSACANTESGKDKTVPEKIAIDLKVAGEKKQSAPSITKLPLKAANGCTADKQENVSSNHKRDKHSKKYKKWKRRISDASDCSQPVKKLIISTKDMQIRRDYVVSHSEEKTNRKKSRKKPEDDDDDNDDDDDYEPSSADEYISACELTSDGSTSSTSYADENSSGYKLSTRGKRRKHSSSSKSSDSDTDSSSRKRDRLSRSKRKRQKKEHDTSNKKTNSSTKDSDSSSKSSEKRSMDQRSTSLKRNPSPLGFDSEHELDRLAQKRRLSTKSPGETDKSLASDAKNRRLETRSPQPSTSGNNKYSRIVPPSSGSESSDEDQPVAPVATSSSKTKPKEVSAPEQTLASSEPVSAGPPLIPDSFDLSDDDVFEDDDLHHGKIAGENPRICDVYNCITPGMSFIITSIATDLEVVGKFQERKAKSSPPAREEISEVVIAKEPEDDEVVPYVCVKKPETREVVQLDSSSEDDEPRPIQIESSPSPEPIQQSPPRDSGISQSTMDAMCAETLFERLETGMALPPMPQPAVNPVAAPVVPSPAPQQPEAAVISQQIPVQTVQPRVHTPVAPDVEQNNTTSFFISCPLPLSTDGQSNQSGIQTQIKITVPVLPRNQPQPMEYLVQRAPQVQEIDRIEQEKKQQEREHQEKINRQKQQEAEGERLLKEQEEFEKEEERKKKEEDRIRQIEQMEVERQKEIERQRKEQEELARQKKKREEDERKMNEELDKQRKRHEEIIKQQRQRAEQERLREQKKVQEEQLQKQLKERSEAIRQNQQAIIPSAPIQPRITVVNLKNLQQQKDQNQSNQPPRVQLPEQRPVARQQQSMQQPQRSYVQPLASPRQSQKQPTRTPIPQPVGLQVVAPLNVHDPAMLNLLQETTEQTLMALRQDATNVKLKYSIEDKKIKATIKFCARLVPELLKYRLVNCCFQPWLIDSLPITCTHWETLIRITIMAIICLEKNQLKIFFDKMRAANLDASLTGFLMQIQRNSKYIFVFPFPKPLEGFDVIWANHANNGQGNQKNALNDFMRKLTEKGELRPDKTQAGKSIVCVPNMDCHLLQVLANAYTVKYLRKYQENHPVPVRTSVIRPVASASSAANNNDVMLIKPNASFLAPGPGVTQQQSVRTVSLAHSGTLVDTTVVTRTVHHLPTSTQPQQSSTLMLAHQPVYTVGDVMGDMVQQMVQQPQQRVQPPPLPLQAPPLQPQPPMVPPPATLMMNQGQFQNDNYHFAMQQNHQYQQPAQTAAWIQTANGNYGHQSSGQQGQANNQWYQRQQSQLQNQNAFRTQPPPSYSQNEQQRAPTQGYYMQQYPVQQPQQPLQWQQQPQPQIMFAQQPTASPTVPNHGNAAYMQQLGLQFEQDVNTEAVAMDIEDIGDAEDLSLQALFGGNNLSQ